MGTSEPALPNLAYDPVVIANLKGQASTASASPSSSEPSSAQKLDGLRSSANVAPPGHGADAQPLGSYLDALRDREHAPTIPKGVSAHERKGVLLEVWRHTEALKIEGITPEDARVFALTGALPDQRDPAGKVIRSGAERLLALESAADGHGSWTAANALTFLVGIRRAALASERSGIEARLGSAPDAARPALAKALGDSHAEDKRLAQRLQQTFARATHGRIAQSSRSLSRANELTARAALTSNLVEKKKLDSEADRLRDDAAKGAYAEAQYRASLPKSGFDTAGAFSLAEDAQVARGRVEIARQKELGMLGSQPPAALGEAKDAGHGVPGAQQIQHEARAAIGANPPPGAELALSRAEAHRYNAVASFHMAHLQDGRYFERAITGAPPPRTAAAERHRDAYLESRGGELRSLERQLGAHERLGAPGTDAALEERAAHAQHRQILDELGGVFAQRSATERMLGEARRVAQNLAGAETDARKAVSVAEGELASAKEQLETARSDNEPWADLRSSESQNRDRELVENREVEVNGKERSFKQAKANLEALPVARARAEEAKSTLETQAIRDRADGTKVARVLAANGRLGTADPGSDPAGAYRELQRAAAHDRRREEELLARVEVPGAHTSAQAGALVSARADLARSYSQSVELDAIAYGKAAETEAPPKLEAAKASLARADAQRRELAPGSAPREQATVTLIEACSDVAITASAHRPAMAVSELDLAERAIDSDLKGDPAAAAKARVGSAAVLAYARHDATLLDVARAGGHDPKADDALVKQGTRLLATADSKAPGVKESRAILARREESEKLVDRTLAASTEELDNGKIQANAKVGDLANTEGKLARARVSTVGRAAVFLATAGNYDAKEDITEFVDGQRKDRSERLAERTKRLTIGANELRLAFVQAKAEGRSSEFLASLRIASDPGMAESREPAAAKTYAGALGNIGATAQRAPAIAGSADPYRNDAIDYIRVALRGEPNGTGGNDPPASVVGRALVSGATLDLAGRVAPYLRATPLGSASEGHQLREPLAAMTRDMVEATAAQGESLSHNSEGMLWYVVPSAVLEIGLGVVLTGGLGSGAVVGEAAEVVHAGRTGFQAVNAARAAMSAFRAAHPVLDAMAVTAAYAGAAATASWAARKTFGNESWAAEAVDLAANFVPVAKARSAAEVGRVVRGAGVAATDGARAVAQLKQFGVLLTTTTAQVTATQAGVPWLADHAGIHSEAGRAALGVAVASLFAGAMTAGARGVTRARSQSEALARQLGRDIENVRPEKAAAAQVEIQHFLESNEGKIPSNEQLATLRSRIASTLEVPLAGESLSGPVTLDAIVESIRVERTCAETLREAGYPGKTLRSEELVVVLENVKHRLETSRGVSVTLVSETAAARDTLEGLAPVLAMLPPETALAATDRFSERLVSTASGRDAGESMAHAPTEPHGERLSRSERKEVTASTSSPESLAPTEPARVQTQRLGAGVPGRSRIVGDGPTTSRAWRDAVRPERAEALAQLSSVSREAIQRQQNASIDHVLASFPPEVRAAAKVSPTLRWQIAAIEAEGVQIQFGPPGKGSFANRADAAGPARIIIDPQRPGAYLTTVAHEAAHVLHDLPSSLPPGEVSKRTYVAGQTDRSMVDEGNAVFNECQVRSEILAAGHPDPGGVGGRYGLEYQAIYERYQRGELTRAKAVDLMAGYIPMEQVSIGTQPSYERYYGDAYAHRYDVLLNGLPTQAAPPRQ